MDREEQRVTTYDSPAEAQPPARPPHRRIPLLVLAGSLLLTLAATLFVAYSARARDADRLANAIEATQDRIQGRMDTYVALLRGGSGLIAAQDTVTRAEFARYVDRLRLRETYPGIQGFGYTVRVLPEELGAITAAQRAADFPDFRIWPARPRAEYQTILFLEPLDRRNRAAIGYDMSTDPIRREAMGRARDTGEAALSGRVKLVQEIEGPVQSGFLVYVPVYRGGGMPPTVAERRARLRGFAYAPFRADDLFANLFGTEASPQVAFRIYDGLEPSPEHLLHYSRTSGVVPMPGASWSHRRVVRIAGRPWTLVFAPTSAFDAGSALWLVPGLAAIGVVVSALLFALSRAQLGARRRAELLAAQLLEQREALAAHNAALASANAALDQARAEAEHANRAKAEFLAAMSHELRTPLNAIAGYTELMEMGIHGPVTEGQVHALGRVRRSQQYLLALINDLLSFARLEAGQVEFVLGRVALDEVLADVRAMTEPQVAGQRLTAHYTKCDPSLAAWGDAEKVKQILLNLVSNAVKFTAPGGEIRIACQPVDGEIQVAVTDTGRGIPSAQLETIFNPFVQVDRRTVEASQQGVGLGLAISRDLARGMNGEIAAASVEGEGSTFTLSLPRAGPPALAERDATLHAGTRRAPSDPA